jgi:preflagellin peptidase FlaK
MQIIFDAVRSAMALSFLLYASWSDYKTREVNDTVWMLFAPLAFALTVAELLLYGSVSDFMLYGLCFVITSAIAVLLFYSGGFGGADSKALMCLALALPFYPKNSFTPLSGSVSPISQILFPMTIFSNSVILVIVPVFWIILRNAAWRFDRKKELFEGTQKNESIGKKILVLLTGYKIPIKKLKEKWHIYPLEDIEEKGDSQTDIQRKLLIFPKDENRNGIVDRLEKAAANGTIKDDVWASPGLPMLIPITIGLVVALFLGDIVWSLVSFILT